MIETPHAEDRGAACARSTRCTATPASRRAEMLAGLDVLVIDLQDIGARIYTYVYTMANCLRACARLGLPVIVCDRPNPIGGVAVEGPMLDPAYASFVGQFPIPMRHGMTIGELARLFNEHFGIGATLEVVHARRLDARSLRRRSRRALGDAVAQHPDAGHGHGLSRDRALRGHDGLRGTRHDASVRAGRRAVGPCRAAGRRAQRAGLCPASISAPRCSSRPSRSMHAPPCGGCQIHVTDRRAFRPVMTGVALIEAIRAAGSRRRSGGGRRPTSTSTTSSPSTSSRVRPPARGHRIAGHAPRRSRRRGPPPAPPFVAARARCLLYD